MVRGEEHSIFNSFPTDNCHLLHSTLMDGAGGSSYGRKFSRNVWSQAMADLCLGRIKVHDCELSLEKMRPAQGDWIYILFMYRQGKCYGPLVAEYAQYRSGLPRSYGNYEQDTRNGNGSSQYPMLWSATVTQRLRMKNSSRFARWSTRARLKQQSI